MSVPRIYSGLSPYLSDVLGFGCVGALSTSLTVLAAAAGLGNRSAAVAGASERRPPAAGRPLERRPPAAGAGQPGPVERRR